MHRVVKFTPRGAQSSESETTTVVDKTEPEINPLASRVQLRLPLRDVAEARIHLALLRAAVDRAEQELTRAQRNHREEEAMIMVRHHLSEANRLINAKRHTHSRERSVG